MSSPVVTLFVEGIKEEAVVIPEAVEGQASIPFAVPLASDSVTVSGQEHLAADSVILLTIYGDGAGVIAQGWLAPIVKNVIAGTSFDILLRTVTGVFTGPVKVNWSYKP